jgi:anti-sigma regulatory factor (Ser/Thr protein kinase)
MPNRRFRCDPVSVSEARRFVREMLTGHPPEVLAAVELMVSELTSNCIRHARSDFELKIDVQSQIRVEVSDTGGGQPTVLSPSSHQPSGRGLRIVEAMADSWGIIPSSSGKTVWFTLSSPSEDGGHRAPGRSGTARRPDGRSRSNPSCPPRRRLRYGTREDCGGFSARRSRGYRASSTRLKLG